VTKWHETDWAKVSPSQIAVQCSPTHILSVLEHAQHDLAALQARCAALEKALRPLAEMAPHFPRQAKYGNRSRSGTVYSCASHGLQDAEITVESLHAAAALLSPDAPAEGAKE
jgi:hypothetical protein